MFFNISWFHLQDLVNLKTGFLWTLQNELIKSEARKLGFLDARLWTKYIYRKASEMHSHYKSLKYETLKR